MNAALEQKIRQCPTLPSLPAIAVQVIELTQREDADIAEIAKVISKDPALSSKILRTVNSSFYGRSQTISTISHALVLLGLQSVKTLVLGFSLISNLSRNENKAFKHAYFWRRSIYSATAAKLLAKRTLSAHGEEAFLCGLLMDIGMLVFDQVLGDDYGNVIASAPSHVQLPAAEQETLGMTHAEVAAILTSQWNLPPLLSVPIAHHHQPDSVAESVLRDLSDVVCCASRCADVFVDENPRAAIEDVRRFFNDHWQMSQEECDKLLEEINGATAEFASLLEVVIEPTNFETILKKANEQLLELTLSTQQQAAALQAQNQKLRVAATTDSLTGLANRAQFDEFLQARFVAAVRDQRPLALIMWDLDNFKHVNDQYGHQAGDAVLSFLGRLLLGVTRTTDLASRYGGEEVALVLPNTTRQAAAAVAENLRRAIAARPFSSGGKTITVTASAGVAVYEHPCPFREPAHLIKAADLSLYAAKKAGRNCVKVFSLGKKTAA